VGQRVIVFRSFRNSDPPQLVAIWRGQGASRGLAAPVTTLALEEWVFSKLMFEPRDLLVAEENGRIVAFVHAGCLPPTPGEQSPQAAPNGANGGEPAASQPAPRLGVVFMLMSLAHPWRDETIRELLALAERHLAGQGATHATAIGVGRQNPLYFGLYGGSEPAGVLDSDPLWRQAYQAAGYGASRRIVVFQRELATFRPLVDRVQIHLRRRTQVHAVVEPPPRSWWDACTLGAMERVEFSLRPSDAPDSVAASVMFWLMTPMSVKWGVRAAGMLDLTVPRTSRRQGQATCLLGEALVALAAQGITMVEAHAAEDNRPTIALFEKLGFRAVDHGTVFDKPLVPAGEGAAPASPAAHTGRVCVELG
jgi:ribosomal protein S18 acetylase RimI-like enzyme